MKIYMLSTEEKGATCIYSKNNKVTCLHTWEKYDQYIKNDKYYLFYPVRSLDALDIDRSECSFFDEEKRYLAAVYDHVFKSDVEYYPVFKLRRENVIDSGSVYATDNFTKETGRK